MQQRRNRARPTLPSPNSNFESTIFHDKSYEPSAGAVLRRIISKWKRDKYLFRPLPPDSTRLLIVDPRRKHDDDIFIELKEVPFALLGTNDYKYEALSYHWGPGEAEKPLLVRTQSEMVSAPPMEHMADVAIAAAASMLRSKKFWVKPNLYSALHDLRMSGEKLTLWVDAICIDQGNHEEKEMQIARLVDIFSRAEGVIIWLGPGDERTKRAFPFVREIVGLPSLKSLVSDQSKVTQWRDLMHLMKRSWFSRRWVIQELAFAKDATVHCGHDTVHWYDLRDAISLFALHFDDIRGLLKRSPEFDYDFHAIDEFERLAAKSLVDTINNVLRKHQSTEAIEATHGFEYLVSSLSFFDTSDPRDTVHALRNIAKETMAFERYGVYGAVEPPPAPDYKKDLLQVYTEFVRWVIRTSKSADILCRHWALPERDRPEALYPALVDLPSWIQLMSETPFGRNRKTSPGAMNGDSFVGLPGHAPYNASYGMPARVLFPQDLPSNLFLSPYIVHDVLTGSPTDLSETTTTVELTVTDEELEGSQPAKPPGNVAMPSLDSKRARLGDDNQLSDATVYKRVRSTSNLSQISIPQLRVADTDGGYQPQHGPRTHTPGSSYGGSLDFSERAARRQQLTGRDHSIYIDGMQIGVVDWTTEIPDGLIPNSALRKLHKGSKGGELVPDKLWRTLVAERGPDGRNPPPWYYRACYHCVVNGSPSGHIHTRELLAKSQPEILRSFLKRVQAVTWNRQFLEIIGQGKQEKLLHGLGPGKAQKGDLLCILYGCSVPCILRRHLDRHLGEYYAFLGEAYVYGVMDGEAVSSMKEPEIKEHTKTFRLL